MRPAKIGLLATTLILVVLAPVAARATEDRLLGRRLKDAAITALVKTRLIAARPANAASIDVDTDEGVVRLRGTVPGPAAWAEAQRLASETAGVLRVRNELQLNGPVSEQGSG